MVVVACMISDVNMPIRGYYEGKGFYLAPISPFL
jgi:hypothetical protein